MTNQELRQIEDKLDEKFDSMPLDLEDPDWYRKKLDNHREMLEKLGIEPYQGHALPDDIIIEFPTGTPVRIPYDIAMKILVLGM